MAPNENAKIREKEVANTSTSASPGKNTYTWQDVAKHNTAEDCWVSLNGKVYNITNWMDSHPGGKEILQLVAGRDISIAFDCYHPFTNKAREVLPKFEIGTVVDHEFPPYPKDSGFYKTLRERVNAYFEKNKIDHKNMTPGLIRMAIVMPIALLANYFAFGPLNFPFFARVVFAILFGICQALPLLHVMHDCSHAAFGHKQAGWMFWGRLFMDFYVGCSMTSWHNQHTIGHHIYTNIFGADPDMPTTETNYSRRIVSRQKWEALAGYQHIYLPIAYGLLGMVMRMADITDVFIAHKDGPIRVNPHGFRGHFEHILSKLFFLFWRVYLPLKYGGLDAASFWGLWWIAELTTGYWLAYNFQVSHISDVADYPMSEKGESKVPLEWAVAQVVSSVDYSHRDWFTTFCCGALNFQIEHHLFPTVSQYLYPQIAPIVMEVCKEYNVKYNYLPDYTTALKHHLKHLYNMSKKGKMVEMH